MIDLPEELRERYQVIRRLGAGGFGDVLEVQDRELGRRVALKLLRSPEDPEFAARFQREARVTASLRHPSVVEVYDHGVSADGTAFIFYELIDGRNLEQEATDGFTVEDIVGWGSQIAAALAAAHEAGVVHRDVKPANLLIRTSGQAVLCDFGIAQQDRSETVLTQEGRRMGTPPFMAPEVFLEGSTTPAGDQFALAATLYRMIARRGVYGSDELKAILGRLKGSDALGEPFPSRIPEPLRPPLRRALSRDPGERYPDCAAFGAALERVDLSRVPEDLRQVEATVVLGERPAAETPRRGEAGPGLRRHAPLLVGPLLLLGLAWWWSGSGADPPTGPVTTIPEEDVRAAQAAELFDRQLEKLAAPHLKETLADGRWRAFSTNREHLKQVAPHFLDAAFQPRIHRLLNSFEAWLEARGPAALPADPGHPDRRRIDRLLDAYLFHLIEDLEQLQEFNLDSMVADSITSRDLEMRTAAVEIVTRFRLLVGRFVRDLDARWPEKRLWQLERLSRLASNVGTENELLESFKKRLLDGLRASPGRGDSRQERRRALAAVSRLGWQLQRRGRLACAEVIEEQVPLSRMVPDLLGPEADGQAVHGAFEIMRTLKDVEGACPRANLAASLRAMRPALIAAEEELGRLDARLAVVGNLAGEIEFFLHRVADSDPSRLTDAEPEVGMRLRELFWLKEKIHALIRHQGDPLPQDEAELQARARELLTPVRGRSGTETEQGVAVAFLWRALRIVQVDPDPRLLELALLARDTPFPARTFFAARLRGLLLSTADRQERARLGPAMEAFTRDDPRVNLLPCDLLRGNFWGQIHGDLGAREAGGIAMNLFSTTGMFPDFLEGSAMYGLPFLRRCPGMVGTTDRRQIEKVLGHLERLAHQGRGGVPRKVCKSIGWEDGHWREVPPEAVPVRDRLAQLCR